MSTLLQYLYPSLIWRVPVKEKILYLTFDDGPIPEVTPWVLDTLEEFGAKATFFCIGDNVKKHPVLYREILSRGHRTGNHTQNHVNGWTTGTKEYFRNVTACRRYVQSDLFRPPYGKIRTTQIAGLKKHYRIVMWDVLSKDYDRTLSGENCYKRVLHDARPGSIVVFHDSLKAEERIRYALPKVLHHFSGQGYTFRALSA